MFDLSLKDKKPHVPRANLEDFFILCAGTPKGGKTSLFVSLAELYFKDINKCLLLAFEKGYSALKVVAEDISTWSDFEDIADELVEEKDSLPFQYIGLDTVDVLYEMAQDEVIREWNIKNPNKRTTDISGVGAKGNSDQGYGAGYQKVKQKIRKIIDKLMKSGYGIFAISHSKDKEIEQRDGLTYDQLVVSLPGSAREVFINMADFVIFVTIEKEKSGADTITKRYMYFRTDGYVEAGSRFANVPEKIEYDTKEFLEVIQNAVISEYDENVNIDEIKKQQKEERDVKSKKYVEKEKNKKTPEQLQGEIKAIITKLNKDGKAQLKEEFTAILGHTNYTKIDDTNLLEECLTAIEKIKSA